MVGQAHKAGLVKTQKRRKNFEKSSAILTFSIFFYLVFDALPSPTTAKDDNQRRDFPIPRGSNTPHLVEEEYGLTAVMIRLYDLLAWLNLFLSE